MTGITNATLALVNVATSIKNQVVNTAYSIVEPHYNAYQAGVYSEQMELKRIVASTTGAGIDNQSLQRANDNGVYRNYQAQGVDPALQVVPTGPMQRLTFGNKSGLNPEELTMMTTVDSMFRAGKVQVYAPGEINSTNGAQILGPVYNELNAQQKFGLANTVYVSGEVNMASFGEAANTAGFTDKNAFGGAAIGGMVVIDTVTPPTTVNVNDTKIHELQHAGDIAIFQTALVYMKDPTLTSTEKAIANAAGNSAWLIQSETFDAVAVNSNYVNRYEELRGYGVNEANMETLAKHIAEGVDNQPGVVDADDIPIDEARIMAEGLVNSTALQDIDDDINAFLDFLETK